MILPFQFGFHICFKICYRRAYMTKTRFKNDTRLLILFTFILNSHFLMWVVSERDYTYVHSY